MKKFLHKKFAIVAVSILVGVCGVGLHSVYAKNSKKIDDLNFKANVNVDSVNNVVENVGDVVKNVGDVVKNNDEKNVVDVNIFEDVKKPEFKQFANSVRGQIEAINKKWWSIKDEEEEKQKLQKLKAGITKETFDRCHEAIDRKDDMLKNVMKGGEFKFDAVHEKPLRFHKSEDSMVGSQGQDTNDYIFEVRKYTDKEYYDLDVVIVADALEKENAPSVLKNYGGNLTAYIYNKLNENKILKKEVIPIENQKKKCFSFSMDASEINKDDNEPYLVMLFDGNSYVGSFETHFSKINIPFNRENMAVKTLNGEKTSSYIGLYYGTDKSQNKIDKSQRVLSLFTDEKLAKREGLNLPSVFENNKKMRVDFVDETGKVALSKNTETDNFGIQRVYFSTKEIECDKSYELIFYDGDNAKARKHVSNLNSIWF